MFWSYDDTAARDFFAQSLAVSREMNDPNSICMSLLGLGVASWDLGDAELARASYEECLIISRASGDQWSLNQALNDLGGLALETGDYPTARSLHEESLQGRRAMGQKGEVAQTLINLGDLAYLQGDYEAARAYLHESLRLLMQIGDKSSIANLLGVLAGVEVQRAGSAGMLSPDLASTTSREQPAGGEDGARAARLAAGKRAARLVGAAMAWLEAHEEQLQRVERGISEQGITRARTLLGTEEFERTWQEGRAMTLEEAASYALEEWEEGKT